MGDRLGLERELNLLRDEAGATPPARASSEFVAVPARESEIAKPATDVGGYFASVEHASAEATKRFAKLAPLLKGVTLRIVLKSDRAFARVEGDTNTHVFPIQLSRSTTGVYFVQWDATGNLQRIINLATGLPETAKRWSDPALAGANELQAMRSQRPGLVWVTQTIGEPSSSQAPDTFPLSNYPSLSYDEAQDVIRESSARPLVVVGERRTPPRPATPGQAGPPSLKIEGITGGIFDSGRYESRPLDFTYWTHDGRYALVSRAYLCNGQNRTQCTDFYYLVPISDIADFLRFYPLAAAGKSALGMVLLWQVVMEIGVYFVPVIGPIWGLVQTTRGVVDAYKNWDKMKGWEKALVGLDVLLTGVPGGKAVFKGVKGVQKVEEGTEALVKAGLQQADAKRLAIASQVLQNEKKTLQAVEHLGETLRKGSSLSVHEMLAVERAYLSMLKALPATERLFQEARMATRDLDAARRFFDDIALTETHLAGLRALTPEILVTLKKSAGTNSTIVKQVMHAAGESREVAWGIIHLQTTVRPDHLAHVAASLGPDVMRQLGSGRIGITDDLAKLAKSETSLEKAYAKLMSGGRVMRIIDGKRRFVAIEGLAAQLQRSRPKALPADLAALEKQFRGVYLTEGQLRGITRLSRELQQALGKGARPADLHRIATTASQWPEAAAVLNTLTANLLAARRAARFDLVGVLGRLDPGFVDLIAKTSVKFPDDAIARAAMKADSAEAVSLLLEGSRLTRPKTTGMYDLLAEALQTQPNAIGALARMQNRVQAGHVFGRWATHPKNPARLKGVSAIMALRPKNAAEKIRDIYLGFPNDYQSLFSTIDWLHDVAKPGQLDTMVDTLATAALTKFAPEIGQGATLTLAYARKHMKAWNPKVAQAFEVSLPKPFARRYDLVLGNVHVECKLWTVFEGRQVVQAEREFAQDVLYALSRNALDFSGLRWVFSQNMSTYRTPILEMMEGVVTRNPEVVAALKKAGKDPNTVRDSLRAAADARTGWLLDFF